MCRREVLAAMATVLGHRPIGVFQGGCNEPTMARTMRMVQRNEAQFLIIPVFLSGGDEDHMATREQVEEVRSNLRRNGFKRVRYSTPK